MADDHAASASPSSAPTTAAGAVASHQPIQLDELIIPGLTWSALAFSIAEFGMALGSTIAGARWEPIYYRDPSGRWHIGRWVHRLPAWEYIYLTSVSGWSMIVCVLLIVVPWVCASKAKMQSKAIVWANLVVNAFTTVAWLVGLAAIVTYNGQASRGLPMAQEALAVLPWLMFLFLTFLNIGTVFGRLRSTRYGYGWLMRKA